MRNIQQKVVWVLTTTVLGPDVHRLILIDSFYNIMALDTNEFLCRFVWAAGRRILPVHLSVEEDSYIPNGMSSFWRSQVSVVT